MQVGISCSDLCKQSAMQMCYLRNNPDKKIVTGRMIEGYKHQLAHSTSEYKEMRGCFDINGLLMYYVFDEILIDGNSIILTEYKNVTSNVLEDWYINRSVLQVALYHSLLIYNTNKDYYTATFFRNLGNPVMHLNVGKYDIMSVLYMGDIKYIVEPLVPNKIIGFFIDKAQASLQYDSAREFDNRYKWKEYQQLKSFINAY